MTRAFLTALALTAALSSVARADSDGYYCIGKGYIAYQFGVAAPPVAPHRLTIVRFGERGFGKPVVIELPQFQVQGMLCGDDVIRVAAFDAMHTIRLDATATPVGGIESAPRVAGSRLPAEFAAQKNLAALSKPVSTLKTEHIVLGDAANGHTFELEISGRKAKALCVTDVTTRLIEVDAAGKIVSAVPVFTGQGHRECGELEP